MEEASIHTRIVLIDDHMLFRESVARLLEAEAGFHVVGHYGSADEALSALSRDVPDLILLDYDLGVTKGTDFLDRAAAMGYGGRTLVVTADINRSEAAGLIRRGVSGIVMKHSSPADLVERIREAIEGQIRLDQDQLRAVLEQRSALALDLGRRPLTPRELTVLRYVFEGLANKEIGRELQISESAVKATLQKIFEKTGVRTRSQLVRFALEHLRDQLVEI